MSFQKVTHVIFDIDGLLLDTECLYEKILNDVLKTFGAQYTEELRQKILGRREQDTAEILIRETGIKCTMEEFAKVYQQLFQTGLEGAKLMPGAETLVRHLSKHNIPIALATSSSRMSIPVKTRNHLELFKLFNHLVSGTSDPEIKQSKPAPDIFLACATKFPNQPKPSDCLVFEDAPSGVTAAIAAGMQVVMVPDHRIQPDDCKHATLVLKSLEDFVPQKFGLPAY